MARPLIPFVQNGYYASRNWIPLVKGNGFTTSGGGEQEEVWETASGSVVTFDAVAAPLRQLSVSVEPVQNLNGYDNPWPAGGGKNILPITDWFEAGYSQTNSGVTMTVNADGSLTFTGTPTSKADFYLSEKAATHLFNLLTVEAGTYTISQSGIPTGVKFITSGGRGNGFPYTELTSTNTSATGTVTDGTVPFNYFVIRIPAGTSSNGTYKLQLETGSSPSTWTPYSNICPITGFDSVNIWVQPTHDTTAEPTATIQLGETVYGGTLDVVNGTMTVDRYYLHVDAVKSTWGASNGFVRCYRYMTGYDTAFNTPLGSGGIGICNMLTYYTNMYNRNAEGVGLTSGANGYFSIALTTERLNLSGSETSAELLTAMNAWLLDNPLYILYPLATPFELTLTPEQISTLQGTNNVWSDAGDVTVEYRAQ